MTNGLNNSIITPIDVDSINVKFDTSIYKNSHIKIVDSLLYMNRASMKVLQNILITSQDASKESATLTNFLSVINAIKDDASHGMRLIDVLEENKDAINYNSNVIAYSKFTEIINQFINNRFIKSENINKQDIIKIIKQYCIPNGNSSLMESLIKTIDNKLQEVNGESDSIKRRKEILSKLITTNLEAITNYLTRISRLTEKLISSI